MLHFKNEEEAFAAIASLVLSTDKVSTQQERQYLFEKVRGRDPFQGYTPERFTELMSGLNERLYPDLQRYQWLASEEGVEHICTEIKKVVPGERLSTIYEMACALAESDGLHPDENALLNRLGKGLGMR
jgi:tellurite resistance protein